jgi:hypothetical protein
MSHSIQGLNACSLTCYTQADQQFQRVYTSTYAQKKIRPLVYRRRIREQLAREKLQLNNVKFYSYLTLQLESEIFTEKQ